MRKTQLILLCLTIAVGLGATVSAAPVKPRHKAPTLPALPSPETPPPADATTVMTAPASATPGTVQTTLFDGQALDQAGITLGPWGGGNAQDNTALFLENGHAIQVTTLDEYQGGKITFTTPVSLGDMTGDRYLQMTLHFPKVAAQPIRRRPVRRGRFGRGGPGGANGGADTPPEESPTPLVTSLRWVLTLADGRQTEVMRPLPEGAVNGLDWVSIAVPLSVLKFRAGAASPLQSVTVGADGYSQFSIGAIKVVTDDTPLSADAGRSQTVDHGSPVELHGEGTGGASIVRYSWNFGDAAGDAEQAEGRSVTTQYFTAKDYTVTLTVSDVDGVKKPATSTVVIHVQ